MLTSSSNGDIIIYWFASMDSQCTFAAFFHFHVFFCVYKLSVCYFAADYDDDDTTLYFNLFGMSFVNVFFLQYFLTLGVMCAFFLYFVFVFLSFYAIFFTVFHSEGRWTNQQVYRKKAIFHRLLLLYMVSRCRQQQRCCCRRHQWSVARSEYWSACTKAICYR